MENKGISIKSFDGNGDPKEFKKNFNLNAVMFGWDANKLASHLPEHLKICENKCLIHDHKSLQ
ncbi:hypothetical protein BpHYR1_007368 [Brachionus plicatilis]|uniref:Uncharacterized protein n=1 Tax=Brachionus plicatilis TaxID=10195 RepID=A0A3M7SXZ1_BRAPC|nr:hypothetical protein BpHYR1_007368 [Brachionus plicatilis]